MVDMGGGRGEEGLAGEEGCVTNLIWRTRGAEREDEGLRDKSTNGGAKWEKCGNERGTCVKTRPEGPIRGGQGKNPALKRECFHPKGESFSFKKLS